MSPERGGPAPAPDEVERLALTVARRHYLEDRSEVGIGRDLGISRSQVARLLQDAHHDGLVRIEVGAVGREHPDLAGALAPHLGLSRWVVGDPGSRERTCAAVGRALAREVRTTTNCGAHRRDATLAAVRAGPVTTLVVDDDPTRVSRHPAHGGHPPLDHCSISRRAHSTWSSSIYSALASTACVRLA